MALMEFLSENIINTTTMMTVTSGTATLQYLFDRNIELGYSTLGYASTTSAVLSIHFNETTSVSHILLQNHNLKQFRIFYNSSTSNSLYTTTNNSSTSTYISFNTVSVNTIQIQMDDTIKGSEEKSIGELIIAERKLVFERNPSVNTFKPKIDRTQIRHIMPDGGVVLFNIKDKYRATIQLKFIETSFYTSLKSIYEEAKPIYYIPFPTTTGWDGNAYLCVWSGDFDFSFSDNAKNTYSGKILLEETFAG